MKLNKSAELRYFKFYNIDETEYDSSVFNLFKNIKFEDFKKIITKNIDLIKATNFFEENLFSDTLEPFIKALVDNHENHVFWTYDIDLMGITPDMILALSNQKYVKVNSIIVGYKEKPYQNTQYKCNETFKNDLISELVSDMTDNHLNQIKDLYWNTNLIGKTNLVSVSKEEDFKYYLICFYSYFEMSLVLSPYCSFDIKEKMIYKNYNYKIKDLTSVNEQLVKNTKRLEGIVSDFNKNIISIISLLIAAFSIIGLNINNVSNMISLEAIVVTNLSLVYALLFIFWIVDRIVLRSKDDRISGVLLAFTIGISVAVVVNFVMKFL